MVMGIYCACRRVSKRQLQAFTPGMGYCVEERREGVGGDMCDDVAVCMGIEMAGMLAGTTGRISRFEVLFAIVLSLQDPDSLSTSRIDRSALYILAFGSHDVLVVESHLLIALTSVNLKHEHI